MPIFTETETGPAGTTKREWSVNLLELAGVGIIISAVRGAWRWVEHKFRLP